MFPVKEVTEAILALRRRGYSSYLVTNRTGVLLPAHPHQAGQPHLPAGGWGPDSPGPGDLIWIHPLDMVAPMYCGKMMTTDEECRRHVQSVCDDRPAWDFSCLYCGLQFPTELGLTVHTARWCREKPNK